MKYGQGLDWKELSQYPISEEMIRLFRDEVDWKRRIGELNHIFNHISPQFRAEFADRLTAH